MTVLTFSIDYPAFWTLRDFQLKSPHTWNLGNPRSPLRFAHFWTKSGEYTERPILDTNREIAHEDV